jgi:hypothetical protein
MPRLDHSCGLTHRAPRANLAEAKDARAAVNRRRQPARKEKPCRTLRNPSI